MLGHKTSIEDHNPCVAAWFEVGPMQARIMYIHMYVNISHLTLVKNSGIVSCTFERPADILVLIRLLSCSSSEDKRLYWDYYEPSKVLFAKTTAHVRLEI